LYENDDKLKNGLSKKGVEYFYLSNDTNESIANFRETIPLINAEGVQAGCCKNWRCGTAHAGTCRSPG
jgi:hypothetical protein